MPADSDSGNSRIGALDIETYTLKSRVGNLDGLTLPYACGFKYKTDYKDFYLEKGEIPHDVIIRMLKCLVVRKYSGCKLYVHNLSGFDSRFILDALGVMPDYNVDLMGRSMSEIFMIKISKKIPQLGRSIGEKTYRFISVTLVDSLKMQPASLKALSITYCGDDKSDTKKRGCSLICL